MKKLIILLIISLPFIAKSQGSCNLTNASGCVCQTATDTCFLLPDLTISWDALANYLGGPTEYSQSGNGSNDGRLRITGSTPNIGYGPFTVRSSDYYLCGNDTIYDPTGNVTCPDGSSPTNMLNQRIYKKVNGTMTYEDRFTGGMTYHPTHQHMHVDDWVTFTLRIEDPNEPDTLQWQIVGNGAKLGFCLMDYGTCDYYNGHCRDLQQYGSGNILTSATIPNYGLGGGQYGCSPVEQGISVGHTDIYSENLDGMWIDVPPNTCNGNYWIVAHVDPLNNFFESNEDNNWTAIPVNLTQQTPAGNAVADISVDGSTILCSNETVTLEASLGNSYLWSTGDSTRSITVSGQGAYHVEVNSTCGSAVSDTLEITELVTEVNNIVQDSVCTEGVLDLSASGPGVLHWYDSAGTSILDTGSTFTTPLLQASQTYYVQNISSMEGDVYFSEPHDHSGSSQYSGSTYNGYIEFDALSSFVLKSVKVYTDYPGIRIIELRTSGGTVIEDTSVMIPSGTTRISLNFNVPVGTAHQLGTNEASNQSIFGYESPDLKRSGSGINYPYVIDGILSLNDSPYGAAYYYYFYDWEVQGGSFTCTSPRVQVNAVILTPPVVAINGISTSYPSNHSPITLTGQPAGGTFSGPGVTGNIFDPGAAGVGQHQIVYDYTDAFGCSNSTTKDIEVISVVTANAGPDVEICEGDSTTLTATGGVVYSWSTGDQSASIKVAPTATSTYSVTVEDGQGNQGFDDVIVEVRPLPTVSLSGLNIEYADTDGSVQLTGSPFGGTFSGPGITGDIFSPAQAGTGVPFEITYTYTNQFGCTNSDAKMVTVNSAVGINNVPLIAQSVFPNPASDKINIELGQNYEQLRVRIIGIDGKVLNEYSYSDHSGSLVLPVSKLANGIYLLELSSNDQSVISKIVISRK